MVRKLRFLLSADTGLFGIEKSSSYPLKTITVLSITNLKNIYFNDHAKCAKVKLMKIEFGLEMPVILDLPIIKDISH